MSWSATVNRWGIWQPAGRLQCTIAFLMSAETHSRPILCVVCVSHPPPHPARQQQARAVRRGVVGEAYGDAVLGQLMGVGRRHYLVALDLRVRNLQRRAQQQQGGENETDVSTLEIKIAKMFRLVVVVLDLLADCLPGNKCPCWRNGRSCGI